MPNTTIQISTETKKKLDNLKEYRRETYNDTILRLIKETTSQIPQTQPTKTRKEDKTAKTQTTALQTDIGEEIEY